jgi:hypothetical protein
MTRPYGDGDMASLVSTSVTPVRSAADRANMATTS